MAEELTPEQKAKLERSLKGEAVKDPGVGKPTQDKLDKILKRANEEK